MPKDIIALPSPEDTYVGLSGVDADGARLLRKRILPMNGSFIHPGDAATKIYVDEKMAQSLIDNFKRGVCDIVQVPIVNQNNQHTEDPRDNAGRVTGLDYDNTGVYATIKASKYAEDFGKTILGASAFLHLNYIDTATGERVGPTLLHVAATNRPHINGLGDYQDAIKASAADITDEDKIDYLTEVDETSKPTTSTEVVDKLDEVVEPPVVTEPPIVEDTPVMTKEELLAELKDKHGVDVDALTVVESELEAKTAEAAELSAKLDDVNSKLELSGAKVDDIEDLAKSYVQLSEAHKTLSTDIETLKLANANYAQRDAENEVDSLIRAGKVLPAQKDVMVKLSMSDRETFDALVPENPIVKLSESGVTLHEESSAAKYDADIERYKTLAQKLSGRAN